MHRARTYDHAVFFRCMEHTAHVIGTRIYSRARSQLVVRSFIFHVARVIDHCSLHPVISEKLIETCIHHRSIGKLSARRGTAYVSRK